MTVYLRKQKNIYNFLNENIILDRFEILKSICMYSKDLRNLDLQEDRSLSLILNLELVNNLRFINRYLIVANNKLEHEGILVGLFESLEQRLNRVYQNYPIPVAKVFHFWDFSFNRILPKLPYIKKLYFSVTEGRNRPLSKTECLGRLFYCGFDVRAFKEVSGICAFIAKKIQEPQSQKNPSYGFLLKQPRIGRYGKIIHVYKIRTMHPFSEYIHKLVYEKNRLEESGKIKNDFRVTSWGSIFRKNWIDELPMIINWLKGDMKLFGVRPLSISFFNTYPDELKEERIKVKPGLIPPFYVDMPDSIEKVWESERVYLQKYLAHPIKTDLVYLFKSLQNILFRGAKSA